MYHIGARSRKWCKFGVNMSFPNHQLFLLQTTNTIIIDLKYADNYAYPIFNIL